MGTSLSQCTVACSVAKLTVASTPSSLFNFFSIRAAQEAQVIPSRSRRSAFSLFLAAVAVVIGLPLSRLVAGLCDRRAQDGVVEVVAADGDELRVEVDVDAVDAGDLTQLRAHRLLAVATAHVRDGVGDLAHRLTP